MNQKDRTRCLKRLCSINKSWAKKRSIEYTLTLDDVDRLSAGMCVYCGSLPSNILKYNGLELRYSGVDRLESQKGYTRENSVSCCSFCNSLKGSMPMETWLSFLNDVWQRVERIGPWNVKPMADRGSKKYHGGRGWN